MSASLVGSEMCIRDRPQACGQGSPWCALASLTAWSLAPALRQRRPAAVSYTHLTLPTICSV
eukprot:1298710-Alexandrium_andersonii.AAC.1